MRKIKEGDKVEFVIRNPSWKNPLEMKGEVGAVTKDFGGRIFIKKGAVSLDEFVIRKDSLKWEK